MSTDSKTKKRVRARQVLAKVSEGWTSQEIADDMGVCRNTVSSILNSDEVKDILDKSDSDFTRMVRKITERVEQIIDKGEDSDFIKLAIPILKTKGLVKDAVEHHHKFPKPKVIRSPDGAKKLVIGVVEGDQDDDDDDQGS